MFVKDLAKSADKFKKNAAGAAGLYVEGAVANSAKWKSNVEASEDAYNGGLQASLARGAWKKGIAKVGADYYAQRVQKLGNQRYATGVTEGGGNWQEGFNPYAETLKSMQQSAKGFKGSPANATRSTEVQVALRRRKEELA
jgi:hypothetical protein